jgi:hypothetical protein
MTPRTLIIPDIHQDYAFLSRIVAKEDVSGFERVILMGDYFDSRDPSNRGAVSARKTARLIRQLKTQLGERLVLIWGNHDVPYYLASARGRDFGGISELRRREALLGIAPESEAGLRTVFEEWDLAFWRKIRPFVRIQEYLISHAGLHRSHYPDTSKSVEDALQELDRQWAKSMRGFLSGGKPGPLLEAGEARGGGDGAIGGLTWLDWNKEFADDLPFGQIVGHTSGANLRKRGRSMCIDYAQCAYGVLAGELDVRSI